MLYFIFLIKNNRYHRPSRKYTNQGFILLGPTKHFISQNYQEKNSGLNKSKTCLRPTNNALGITLKLAYFTAQNYSNKKVNAKKELAY